LDSKISERIDNGCVAAKFSTASEWKNKLQKGSKTKRRGICLTHKCHGDILFSKIFLSRQII